MRLRALFLGVGSLVTLFLLLMVDPDTGIVQNLPIGAGVIGLLVTLMTTIFYLVVLHWGRKSFLDYLDLKKLFDKAVLTSEGAGYAIIGVSLIMVSISIVIHAVMK